MEKVIDDRAIIRKVLEGDREAYAELVRRHSSRVIRLCAALLSDPVEAEDAAQEVFLKAYRSLKSYRGGSAFSTWLYRLTFNYCTDLLRRRGRQKMEPMEMEIAPDPRPNPQKEWEAGDTVRRLLDSLTEEAKTILILREVQGLSYEETAQVLDCSVDAVKARLRRARQAAQGKARFL